MLAPSLSKLNLQQVRETPHPKPVLLELILGYVMLQSPIFYHLLKKDKT